MTKTTKIERIEKTINKEYNEISKFIRNGEIDKLSFGTSIIYLNSVFEHLHSLKILIKSGFVESAGAIATSLWERSITLQYLLTKPLELSQIHSNHHKVKRTPWSVKQMVGGIIESENNSNIDKELEKEILYIQYTYLCAIKHGNPFTISYLNRLENNREKIIGINPNLTKEDEDFRHYLLLISLITSFEALMKFSEIYCTAKKNEYLLKLNTEITKTIITEIDLKVPQVIEASEDEFRSAFWEYLDNLV
jgi:hypothetical protein